MTNETIITIVVVIVVGLILLVLALIITGYALTAAITIFAFAATQGFIGIAVYIAAWVFLFPVMLSITLILGIILAFSASFAPSSEYKYKGRDLKVSKKKAKRRSPPKDSAEKYKWANRLPPYDK